MPHLEPSRASSHGRRRSTARLASFAACATLAIALATSDATAASPSGADDAARACDAWDVEYVVSANLQLSDTPMGQGDGVYAIGPGRAVVRFTERGGRFAGAAQMLAYEMRERFVVTAKALFFTTKVTTDSRTRATPDACGVVADGVVSDRALRWTTGVRGYRTDGTLTCEGSLCGTFGAPPPGTSALHIGPGTVRFEAFELGDGGKTFTMRSALVSKTDAPKQTAHVALAGREVRRTCVRAPASCS